MLVKGSQLMVRMPLVVGEGLPGTIRVTSVIHKNLDSQLSSLPIRLFY